MYISKETARAAGQALRAVGYYNPNISELACIRSLMEEYRGVLDSIGSILAAAVFLYDLDEKGALITRALVKVNGTEQRFIHPGLHYPDGLLCLDVLDLIAERYS